MKVLEKLKGGLSFLFDKIVKNEKCVYLTSIFLIIGAFAWFNLQLKHSAEMLKVHNDNKFHDEIKSSLNKVINLINK